MKLAFLLIAATVVAACARNEAAYEPASYGPAARSCDDGGEEGGDAGVIIDGVCL